jgi:benzil reductase ((S)-benzoin forming)
VDYHAGMTQHLYILTGASRGMGLAMAQQLLQPGHFLLCLSRHTNPQLAADAARLTCPLEQHALDLQDSVGAAAWLSQWLAAQPAGRFDTATLINNAGVIPPIAPLSASDPRQLSHALRVGLEAPLLLTGAFLGATEGWGLPRKVLNISSGLGRRPMASQAAYCAAKAGMDHFTRCLALDEAIKPHGAKVCSLAPGVIDTDMQVQLRSTPSDAFPDQAGFMNLKTQGQLSSPAEAAQRVLAKLAHPDFGQLAVDDVRS